MRTRDILRTALLAALAATPILATAAHAASAKRVVAATCPNGYSLSGNSCIRSGPAPVCPSGYTFSAGRCVTATTVSTPAGTSASRGPWAFVTRDVYGVESAKELDGGKFCAVDGSNSADAAQDFFKDNGLKATHVKVTSDRAGIEKYQKYGCDVLVVADRVARSTAKGLEPKGGHFVLPEKLGNTDTANEPVAETPVAPVAAATPAALPPKPAATVTKQPAPPAKVKKTPVRTKTARKKRCSAVRYAYTRGNTCSCAGGRVFTGSSCVRRRRW